MLLGSHRCHPLALGRARMTSSSSSAYHSNVNTKRNTLDSPIQNTTSSAKPYRVRSIIQNDRKVPNRHTRRKRAPRSLLGLQPRLHLVRWEVRPPPSNKLSHLLRRTQRRVLSATYTRRTHDTSNPTGLAHYHLPGRQWQVAWWAGQEGDVWCWSSG